MKALPRMLRLVPFALAILAPGCDRTKTDRGKIKIGFLVKMPEEPWFQQEWQFAQRCADKYGFDLAKIGATDGEKVLSAIDNLASQNAQGFVICTPDVRLGPAIMAKAQSYSMKVISVDDQFVGADGKFMNVPYMGISARAIGETVGKALYDEFKKRNWKLDETAACAVTFDELNTVKERTDGATAALITAGFPADRIYRSPEKTTDIPGAFDAAGILLTQHPEVKRWLIFSVNDEGVMGAVRAMEGRGFNADTVIAVGIGGSTCLVECEKPTPTGFFATVLISPLRHGYETTELLYKWIKDGTPPPKDTRTAGILVTRQTYKQVMKEQGLPN
jgi:L-arabinose transport system substrate-binding protein